MRITGGTLRGRRLLAPDDMRVRPTSDRVREALFNMLAHKDFGIGFALVVCLWAWLAIWLALE